MATCLGRPIPSAASPSLLSGSALNLAGEQRSDRLWCFFFLYEGLQYVQKTPTTATVLTPTARQGIYRYFPGVQSANAVAANPTVDLAGNPVIPRGATGALSSASPLYRDRDAV